MFTDEKDIIINNVYMAPYLTSVQYTYSKVWGDDTGRNTLNADFSGTFKGVDVKLTLNFKKNLKPNELTMLSPIFDAPSQTVKYRNPRNNQIRTFISYSGDWNITYKGINKNEGTQISFIDRQVF